MKTFLPLSVLIISVGCVSKTKPAAKSMPSETSLFFAGATYADLNKREVVTARFVSDVAMKKGQPVDVVARLERWFKPNVDSYDVSDCIATGKAMYPGNKQPVIVTFDRLACNQSLVSRAPNLKLTAVDKLGNIGLRGSFDVAGTVEAIGARNPNSPVAVLQTEDAINTEVLEKKNPFMIVSDGSSIFLY